MSRYPISFFSLAVLLIGLLTGCASAPPFNPGARLDPIREGELCRSASAARGSVASFRSLINAEVVGPDKEMISFRYAIIGKGNDRLRVDVLPNEGAFTLALVTVNEGRALVIDTQSKKAIEGCSPGQVLERTLGLEGITPEVVKALVVGEIPALICERVTTHQIDSGKVLFVDKSARVAWEVSEETGELLAARLLDSSGEKVVATADRRIVGDLPEIVFQIYKPARASAELRVVRLTKNREIADDLFDVPVPAGYGREGC
jgi:hypothetical protein